MVFFKIADKHFIINHHDLFSINILLFFLDLLKIAYLLYDF
jgi:hypothetical protein